MAVSMRGIGEQGVSPAQAWRHDTSKRRRNNMSSEIDFDKALGKLDDNSEMIREYWRDLRASWQASENVLRRTLFYIFALAAAFMLLSIKAVGEVSFLGLKVTNLGLVGAAIPGIVAYLTFIVSTNAAIVLRLGKLHDDIAKHYWSEFCRSDLEVTVRPTGSIGETLLVTNATNSKFIGNIAVAAGLYPILDIHPGADHIRCLRTHAAVLPTSENPVARFRRGSFLIPDGYLLRAQPCLCGQNP
jgi:hypothetical protein